MHSSRKKKVVIASTLKPVDDPRLYEKLALTLAGSERYECHIIGAPGGPVRHVTKHELKRVKRLSLWRVTLPFAVLIKIFRQEPDILIIATHELLFVAFMYKILLRGTVLYDVQENYYLNIIHTDTFRPGLRQVIAAWVRLKELVMGRFIDCFLLAEKCFENELGFVRRRSVVVENKVIVPPGFKRKPHDDKIELLFSGTIDESTGVYDAVSIARLLNNVNPMYSLHIIGYCARPEVLAILKDMIAPFPFIRLTGGDTLQPHSKIIDAISKAHIGLVLYRPSPHINNRMPTKLYEYMGYNLPILIRSDLWWCEVVGKAQAGLAVNVDDVEAVSLAKNLRHSSFYSSGTRNMTCEFDRHSLIEAIDTLTAESASPKSGHSTRLTTSG
jgi:glycosyltransferase involved in cell wall biosynthesis